MHTKIMVPLGPEIHDLKSVHYALAAAERLRASVILLRLAASPERRQAWFEEALADLVASARLAGLNVTIVEANGTPVREIADLAESERIDLLVFSEDQSRLEWATLDLAPHLGPLMITVREKDTMDMRSKKGDSRWPS
jgi:hypothetical protein